jgi:hypothetical protein
MPGGVDSVTDTIELKNLKADVTQNVRTEPSSVRNEMLADPSRAVNNEKAPPVVAEAGGRERDVDASVDTTKESDADADVSPAVTVACYPS